MLTLDAVVPLVVYYVVRAFGASPWTALVAGAAVPLLRMVAAAADRRRVETTGWFTLSVLAAGTAVGLLTADPRLLMARESYLTGVAGLWILATLLARHPLVYTATIRIVPAHTASTWQRAWDTSHEFRRVMRGMTLGFGLAFLTDAAARVVMAYTLPLDLVPLLSAVLLVVLLIGVVQAGKAYGLRRLTDVLGPPLAAPGDTSSGTTAGHGSG
jgi:hypothetical protein